MARDDDDTLFKFQKYNSFPGNFSASRELGIGNMISLCNPFFGITWQRKMLRS